MFITALDIGSGQIKAIVAQVIKDNKPSVVNAFREPSRGIRRGEIVDAGEAADSLNRIFNKIKEINRPALKNIFVNVGGANIKCQNSKGIVAVSRADNEISQDDIDRVIKASQAIKLLPNRMIIHTITREFVVDGIGDVREPLGMNGTRLEVNSLIIDAFSPNVKNILNVIGSLGGSVSGLVYNPLASARSVLTKNQKDLGAILIDIGSGTTAISVFEEGKLLHAAGFPVGGGHVTNDLAIGLKCSVPAAEFIKIFFGCALASEVHAKERINTVAIEEKSGIDIKEVDRNFRTAVSRRFIAEIIESRLSEIFEFINSELKSIGRAGQLPGGAVICGGGAKIPDIIDLAKKELKLATEIGLPENKDLEIIHPDLENQLNEPEFAAAVGLLYLGTDQHLKDGQWLPVDKFSIDSIKRILKYFA